jgi:hypothetical protein
VEQPRVVDEVLRGALDGLRRVGVQVVALDHGAQALGYRAAASSVEQRQELSIDPLLGVVATRGMERVRRAPQVFDHVHEVEHYRAPQPKPFMTSRAQCHPAGRQEIDRRGTLQETEVAWRAGVIMADRTVSDLQETWQCSPEQLHQG